MDKNTNLSIIIEFESVLEKHFGPTGVYILNALISDLGRTKEMIREEDLENVIEGLKEELLKVIRYDVETLERELRDIMEKNH
ncbi:MAG: hypothetical protein JSV49_02120 [Thermoplasmata archaeon]|nr:MAG: hypothetical protein JSV49_02120 [Thermoplasmata archaeon]